MSLNVLFVVTGRPHPKLLELISAIRERGDHLLIVCDEPASEAFDPQKKVDVPGCGWLPFDVVELDAISYLAKKDIDVVYVYPHQKDLQGLEKAFGDGASARNLGFLSVQDHNRSSLLGLLKPY